MQKLAAAASLGVQMRFVVTVDALNLGGWSKCEGLIANFSVFELEEGGNNDYKPFVPNRVTYERIKLSRALEAQSSAAVMQWLSSVVRTEAKSNGSITLYDANHEEVAKWSLRGVYPTKWTGPNLDANGKSVAIEVLELIHEGFL